MNKHNFKYLLSVAACVILLCITAFASESPSVMSTEEVNVIKLLEIANGDLEGNMNYDKPVTRAEFIKMVISASTSKDVATASKINTSVFPDVRNTHWAAGYISIAVENGLVNGYLDGNFKPNNNVTLEEAATIILRLLGYTNQDLIGKYPSVQINKYKDLELNSKMSASVGERLTREECMLLIYNALNAKTKNGAVYCTTLGFSTNTEGRIDYTALLKDKLDGPYIIEDVNTPIKSEEYTENAKTTYIFNNTPATKETIKAGDVFYTSKVLGCVFVYRKNATGIVSASTNTGVTVGNHTYAISSARVSEKLSLGGEFSHENAFVTLILGLDDAVVDIIEGDVTLIDSNTDNESYNAMIDATLSSPYLVNSDEKRNVWKNEIPFNPDEASIYVNGKKVVTYSVDLYDVIYYSKPFNGIWIYRDSFTGIIQSCSASSISVGSSSFNVTSNEAKYKLSSYGTYGDGDYVTLILGKNDEVIDIIDGDSSFKNSDSNDQSFLEMIEDTISDAIYIDSDDTLDTWKEKIPFDVDKGTVYVSGRESKSYIITIGDVIYYSEPFTSVWIFRETQSGILTSISGSTVSVGSKAYTLASDNAKFKVSAYGSYRTNDYVTLILGKNDEVIDIKDATTDGIGTSDNDSSYSEVVSSTLKGPYVVAADGSMDNLKIKFENATIFYKGKETDSSVINPYDVYYFSEVLETIWIYRDKVSGTIESATPASSPTTLVLSGNTYAIDSSKASYELSNFGIYDVGDRVTLLLGMDNEVAGIISTEISTGIIYGIITDKGEKTYVDKNGDEYTSNYVTVTDTSATSHTYEYINNKLNVGSVVRVVVGTVGIQISTIYEEIGRGEAAELIYALKNGNFADNCEIIDVSGSDVIKVLPSRISGVELEIDMFLYTTIVKYYEFDDDHNLTKLILNNFTGDMDDYGVVVSSKNGTINYRTDSVERSFTPSQGTGSCSSGPARFRYENGSLVNATAMNGYIESIDLVTPTAIYDDKDNEYLLSDDVKIFIKNTNTTYTYTSLDEVYGDNYELKAYYDKLPQYGGRIRVIIAIKKY